MRIAIVGSGIAGLTAAHRLHGDHDVTVYEAAAGPGGHSNTVDVVAEGRHLAIDTGFIVYNERNYPQFTALLRELGVATQATDMSFALSCEGTGLEYNGHTLRTLFAQRRNLLRPSFLRMLRDIVRLNGRAAELVAAPPGQTLGRFLDAHGFSGPVVDDYLLPMAGAIWTAEPARIRDFPAANFGRFCANHGLLGLTDRPEWRTITGGSREYVRALVAPFRDRLRLETPVEFVRRLPDSVVVKAAHHAPQTFDAVVLACHSDQALALLRDPTPAEREILAAIPYQDNEAVLHTDTALLPRRPLAQASWNYMRFAGGPGGEGGCTVTYDLTRLQRLPTRQRYLVTLNATHRIDPAKIVRRMTYAHPVYTAPGMAAQMRWPEISGRNRTYFCGAWWGYGFHEDGVRSGAAVAATINGQAFDEELHLRRVG